MVCSLARLDGVVLKSGMPNYTIEMKRRGKWLAYRHSNHRVTILAEWKNCLAEMAETKFPLRCCEIENGRRTVLAQRENDATH